MTKMNVKKYRQMSRKLELNNTNKNTSAHWNMTIKFSFSQVVILFLIYCNVESQEKVRTLRFFFKKI